MEGYFHSVSVMPDGLRQRMFSAGMRRELQGYHAAEVLRKYLLDAPAEHPLSRVQYADMKTYLPGDILTKVDRASMAHSLEVRVPLLDHSFVEWAGQLPAALKLRGRTGKYLLTKALEPFGPHDLLSRPKLGVSVPLAGWLRGPLRQRVRARLTGSTLQETGLFEMGFVETLLDQHQSGLRDHSGPLWALVMFECFLRQVHTATPLASEQMPISEAGYAEAT